MPAQKSDHPSEALFSLPKHLPIWSVQITALKDLVWVSHRYKRFPLISIQINVSKNDKKYVLVYASLCGNVLWRGLKILDYLISISSKLSDVVSWKNFKILDCRISHHSGKHKLCYIALFTYYVSREKMTIADEGE